MLADPYLVYERLRTEDPVHRHEQLAAWVVTRHDDCTYVLRRADLFGSDPRALGRTVPPEVLSLQTMDPPEHTAVRHSFLTALRRRGDARWEEEVRRVAARAVRAMRAAGAASGPVDLVEMLAEPVALHAMCALYGIRRADDATMALFRTTSRTMVLGMDSGLDPTRREPALRARTVLNRLLLGWRADAEPDGVLAEVSAGRDGDVDQVTLNSLRAVFDAGYSTTANMIGNALLHLLRRGPLTATVAESVDPNAVDELTRVDGVVQAISRHCLADTELRGIRLRHGDVVIVVLAAANHDPLVFSRPREFDPTRDPNPHLGFGRGVHSCLGSHFGRRVLCAVFAALGDALGDAPAGRVELAGPWTQRPTATQRGLDRLPVLVR